MPHCFVGMSHLQGTAFDYATGPDSGWNHQCVGEEGQHRVGASVYFPLPCEQDGVLVLLGLRPSKEKSKIGASVF